MKIPKTFIPQSFLFVPVVIINFIFFYVAYELNLDAENYKTHYDSYGEYWELIYNALVSLSRSAGLSYDQFYFCFVLLEAFIAGTLCTSLKLRAFCFLVPVFFFLGDDVFGTQIRFGLSILFLCLSVSAASRKGSLIFLGLASLTHNVALLGAVLVLVGELIDRCRRKYVPIVLVLSILFFAKFLAQDALIALNYIINPESEFFGKKSTSSILFNSLLLISIVFSRRSNKPWMVNTRRLSMTCFIFLAVALIFYDSAMIGGRVLFMALPLQAIYLGVKLSELGKFGLADWVIALLLISLVFVQYL